MPITVQQTIDRGLDAPGGPDSGVVWEMTAVAAVAILVTAGCATP